VAGPVRYSDVPVSSNGCHDDLSDINDDVHDSLGDCGDVYLTLYVMSLSLNVIRCATGSQCSDCSRGMACVSLGTCNTTRDKEFFTFHPLKLC